MNPCTLMGGFWFEAGRVLFNFAVGVSCIVVFLVILAVCFKPWRTP